MPIARFRDYMTKKQLEPIQRRLNSTEGKALADSKLAFHDKCLEVGLPSPPIYALLTRSNTEDLTNGIPVISNAEKFLELLIAQGDATYVLKPQQGWHGEGLRRFHLAGSKIAYLVDGVECLEEPHTYLSSLLSKTDAYLLQKSMMPHEALRSLMPGAGMGTVRVVTVNSQQGARVTFACAKIPMGDNVSDNFVGGQAGNLVASVDLETGALGTVYAPGPVIPTVLASVDRHPVTGLSFTGYCYPNWSAIKDLALRAASKFDSLYTAGWDIALTTDGPVLIETNWRYDVDILQIASQRPLRSEMISSLAQRKHS